MSQTDNQTTPGKSGKPLVYIGDIIKGLRKFWIICLVLIIGCGGAMFYRSYKRFTPIYSSSVTFTVSTQNTSLTGGGISTYSFYYDTATADRLTSSFPYILQSNLMYNAICERFGIDLSSCSFDRIFSYQYKYVYTFCKRS